MIELHFDGFLKHLQEGFLRPQIPSYGYLDKVKFENFLRKKSGVGIQTLFFNLKNRMSEEYYQEVFLAQAQTMHYSSLCFPPYSKLLAEDLADDWLAIVDFHKKFARDHSLHQPLTAYIVAELLGYGDTERSLKLPNDDKLLECCVETIVKSPNTYYLRSYAEQIGLSFNDCGGDGLKKEIWKRMFYRTAILASLFHDIGYPWQYVRRVGTGLENCSKALSLNTGNAELIISQFKNRMIFLPFNYYQHKWQDEPVGHKEKLLDLVCRSIKETHGFPGGIAFLSLYDAVRSYPIPQTALLDHFSMEWAAMAIMMHDMKDICKGNPELRINFSRDPLSAVVSLADFLEEFNRPLAKFSAFEKESRIEYTCACDKVEVEVSVEGGLMISMHYKDKGSYVAASVHKAKEAEQCFNPVSGFINLSDLGIVDVQFTPYC